MIRDDKIRKVQVPALGTSQALNADLADRRLSWCRTRRMVWRLRRRERMSDSMSDATDTTLDDLDRELLNALQWDFPRRRPAVRGARASGSASTEDEVLRRGSGGSRTPGSCASCRRSSTPARSATARRSSPRRSTPTASTTPPPSSASTPGVSHNYKRNHAYNLWYTLAVPPGDVLDDHLDVLHRGIGRARHPQAADAQALQDRREARHDRPDRGRREGRGARARAARAHAPDMEAPELSRPRGRRDPHRAGGPPARSSGRSRSQAAQIGTHRGRAARPCSRRSRSAS